MLYVFFYLQAKIQCSTLCKCVGCKNCDESTKSLLDLANAADQRKQQHNPQQQYNNYQGQQVNANNINSTSQLLNANSQNVFSLKQASFGHNRSSLLWNHNASSSFLGSDLASKSFNGLDTLNSYQKSQLEQQQILKYFPLSLFKSYFRFNTRTSNSNDPWRGITEDAKNDYHTGFEVLFYKL